MNCRMAVEDCGRLIVNGLTLVGCPKQRAIGAEVDDALHRYAHPIPQHGEFGAC